jgi:type IV secretion system protein TrbE
MLNLAEYRKKPQLLADYLPWACLIAPGVVLNKDGSFQRTAQYRGPDLDSATDGELVAVTARINNVLKRFGAGWALFFEARRQPSRDYPSTDYPDPVSWLVDEERREAFQREGTHYETIYYLTFTWLPPAETQSRAEGLFVTTEGQMLSKSGHSEAFQYLDSFIIETDRALDLLASILPEAQFLDDEATLSYLHACVSVKDHRIVVPKIPAYLDAILTDCQLTGGLKPMLEDQHLRSITVLGFPNVTVPGLLDELNDLGLSYRWVTRWIALDRDEAQKLLTRTRRQWFAKRKSIAAILREVMFNQESVLLDTDADNKARDADEALQDLGSGDVAFGHLTATITVSDADEPQADESLRAIERVVNGSGFVSIRETFNAVDAWLGSLPGQVYANVRQPIVHTLNLAHMMPASAVWAGPDWDFHLGGPPLLHASTRGSTPFRLCLHVSDVGHSFVVGPTGAGKSVLLALLALQFRRYAGSQVFIFDKGRSARATILAMGGLSFDLGLSGDLAFQPLTGIDEHSARAFALDWLLTLVSNEGVGVTPEIKEALWGALTSLASAPKAERTLTGFSLLLQSNALRQALQPYTLEGPYGQLLDAGEDRLTFSDVMHFELEELMQAKGLVLPVLSYLFHRLEERFDGQPTLLILDEAWLFLDHPLFAARIREWLKALRKKNVAVVFATQSLADIAGSSIAPAIIESCPTRIFLPNDRAIEPQMRETYEHFGLNPRQIEIISRAAPKRDYYAQTARGNRLFELGLGPLALALCGASKPEDHRLIDHLLAEHGPENFPEMLLRAKGFEDAADLIWGAIENAPQQPTSNPVDGTTSEIDA